MRQLLCLSLGLTLISSACSDGKGGSKRDASVNVPGPSLVNGTTTTIDNPSAGPKVENQNLPFALSFDALMNGEELTCNDLTPEKLSKGQIFTDLRFFVTNVVLVNDAGEDVPLKLDVEKDSTNFQFVDAKSNQISLLNFIDASCASTDATKTLKNVISGTLANGHYKAIKFQLGLPYAAKDPSLTKLPATLQPSDMAWMWEHYPAEFQLETAQMVAGTPTFKTLNALLPESPKRSLVTLELDYTHEALKPSPKIALELSRLFVSSADAFFEGIDDACQMSTKVVSEKSPACAQAFKALGLEVANPKAPYTQSIFTLVP